MTQSLNKPTTNNRTACFFHGMSYNEAQYNPSKKLNVNEFQVNTK